MWCLHVLESSHLNLSLVKNIGIDILLHVPFSDCEALGARHKPPGFSTDRHAKPVHNVQTRKRGTLPTHLKLESIQRIHWFFGKWFITFWFTWFTWFGWLNQNESFGPAKFMQIHTEKSPKRANAPLGFHQVSTILWILLVLLILSLLSLVSQLNRWSELMWMLWNQIHEGKINSVKGKRICFEPNWDPRLFTKFLAFPNASVSWQEDLFLRCLWRQK